MQTLELPSFSPAQITPPIDTSLKETQRFQLSTQQTNFLAPLENALKDVFLENVEEGLTIKTRRILGEKARNLSDEQIECVVTEFQFLINTWLDEFEKDIFSGMTLKEVLNEK